MNSTVAGILQAASMNRGAFFLLFTVHGSVAAAADPVAEFAANYPFMARGTFTASVHIQPDHPKTSSEDRIQHISMDPPRWKIVARAKGVEMQRGKLTTSSSRAEAVIPEIGSATINVGETNVATDGISAYIKPLPPELAKESALGFYSYAVNGIILCNDCLPLSSILSKSEVKESSGLLGGISTVVLTASGKWGKHVIWLDPARNYLPLRITQEKGPEDLVDRAKPLRSEVKDRKEKPPIVSERLFQQFDTTRTEKIGGRFVVTGFTRRLLTTYSDKSEYGLTGTVSITNIKPVGTWDKDPFVFTATIPDGSPVTVHDDKPIEYEWRGGKIVKKINTAAVETMDSVEFKPPQSGNFVKALLVTLVAFATVGIGYIVWRRFSARRVRP